MGQQTVGIQTCMLTVNAMLSKSATSTVVLEEYGFVDVQTSTVVSEKILTEQVLEKQLKEEQEKQLEEMD